MGTQAALAHTWQQDVEFAPVLESWDAVSSPLVLASANGKLLVQAPDSINGVSTRWTLARLNPDGVVDKGFVVDATTSPTMLATFADGGVLVRRRVDAVVTTYDVARLRDDGTVDPGFAPARLNVGADARAMVLPDGRVLLWGSFTTVSGVPRKAIAVLEANGAVSDAFTSPFAADSSASFEAFPFSDGSILLAGYGMFPNASGQSSNFLVRLKPDGTRDESFTASATAITQAPGQVYERTGGGMWVAVQGALWALNVDGSLDATGAPQLVGSDFVFGPRQATGGKIYYIARASSRTDMELRRFNADGSVDHSFVVATRYAASYGVLLPVVATDGRIYVPNALTESRYTSRFMVTRLQANGAVDPTFAPRFSRAATVYAMVRQPDGKLVVAGALDHANGAPSGGLVRLNTDGSTDTSFAAPSGSEDFSRLDLQPSGKIIANGTRRLDLGGSVDPTFSLAEPLGIFAVAPDGRIYGTPSATLTVLQRFTVDGVLDPTFRATFEHGVQRIAPLSDGKVLVLTKVLIENTQFTRLTLVRLLPDGTRDATFDIDSEGGAAAVGFVPLPEGRVVVISSGGTLDGVYLRYDLVSAKGEIERTFIGRPAQSHYVIDVLANDVLTTAAAVYDFAGSASAFPINLHLVAEPLGTLGHEVQIALDASGKLTVGHSRTWSTMFAHFVRPAGTAPTVDPEPIVLSVGRSRLQQIPLRRGETLTLSANPGGLFPFTYQWLKDGVAIPAATAKTYRFNALAAEDQGNYAVVVTNAYGSATSASTPVAVDVVDVPPLVTQQPEPSQTVSPGGAADFYITASGNPVPSIQWYFNGAAIPEATRGWYSIADAQPVHAGIYWATLTSNVGRHLTNPSILGIASTDKVVGSAHVAGSDITHVNGNIYDQILLEGAGATITADPRQITRTSFVDLTNDIVQVEFSGAGTLSLVVDGEIVRGAPVNYVQPGITYTKGHAGIVITGADESTHVSVFSVGRATALNQTLFRDDVTYDGVADIAYLAIASTNGKFGGVRAGNAHFYHTKGFTGIYAPGVQFTGPVYVGDITAFDGARPALIVGGVSDAQITGGSVKQENSAGVEIAGIERLRFTNGTSSHGKPAPAQLNAARFVEPDGTDVTQHVVDDSAAR